MSTNIEQSSASIAQALIELQTQSSLPWTAFLKSDSPFLLKPRIDKIQASISKKTISEVILFRDPGSASSIAGKIRANPSEYLELDSKSVSAFCDGIEKEFRKIKPDINIERFSVTQFLKSKIWSAENSD